MVMATQTFPATGFKPLATGQPADQAQGLRQLFAASRVRFVALVHNPHVAFSGIAMERLTSAFAQQGLRTLVVDAADSAAAAAELAAIELTACVEPLSRHVCYLAARGLPMRYLDARGSTAAFLGAAADAAPQAEVVLVHASAMELWRLFTARSPRPVLLAADHPDSLTHAYASMKLLSQRLGTPAFDLLIAADPASPRMARIADRLADTADRFLGVALHDWTAVDPACQPEQAVTAPLRRLALAQLRSAEEPEISMTSQPTVLGRTAAAWHSN